MTIQLLITSTILSIIIGVTIGIVTALRQYSGFDYGVTLVSFFLFSMPSFFVAVILKMYFGIGFNDFLEDPSFNWIAILVVSLIFGVIWMAIIGGDARRRGLVFGVAALATAVVMIVLGLTKWFVYPQLSVWFILIVGVGGAFALTHLFSSLRNRRALGALLTVAVLGVVMYLVFYGVGGFGGVLSSTVQNVWVLLAFGVVAIASGAFVGWAWGGPDKWLSARLGGILAFVLAFLTFVDRLMKSWYTYAFSDIVNGRPIATVGSSTPNLNQVTSSFWIFSLDSFTHLLLPTMSICLISMAGYSRYARASLLDVMGQDYIRTARAKGLPERTVVLRHAFRNSLIPLATLITLDFGALIGGAIITETVFAWSGMGRMFNAALQTVDVNPLMGFFLVTGSVAIAFNLVADLIYSALDPRIRVVN